MQHAAIAAIAMLHLLITMRLVTVFSWSLCDSYCASSCILTPYSSFPCSFLLL